jgi:hypothetical protein
MVIPAQIIAHKIRYLRYQYYNWGDTSVEEEFKDTKEIIRIRKSKKSITVTYALVEQEVLTLPGHPISPPVLVGFVLLDL